MLPRSTQAAARAVCDRTRVAPPTAAAGTSDPLADPVDLLLALADPSLVEQALARLIELLDSPRFSVSLEHAIYILPLFSMYDPSAGAPPSVLCGASEFLSELLYNDPRFADAFARDGVFHAAWSAFPHFGTPSLFACLLHFNEMSVDYSCNRNRSLDEEEVAYNETALRKEHYPTRVVVHFCMANGAVEKVLAHWDECLASDSLAWLKCVAAFAGYGFTFAAFAPIRPLLLQAFFRPPKSSARRMALRAIGRFASRSNGGIQWFLEQNEIVELYRNPPFDDQPLIVAMLDVLGDAGRDERRFGICQSMALLPPELVDILLRFMELCLESSASEVMDGAVVAIGDCITSDHIADVLAARGILHRLSTLMNDDIPFRIKTEVMRVLATLFTVMPGQSKIEFANSGFFDALFDWFTPMFRIIPNELVDAIRTIFDYGRSNPELSHWINLPVENDAIRAALDSFGTLVLAPMSPEINAFELRYRFDDYIARQQKV
jgi:hypothetical protein